MSTAVLFNNVDALRDASGFLIRHLSLHTASTTWLPKFLVLAEQKIPSFVINDSSL